ncbi:MAG: trehalase [Weeksellaceae bacterium]|nr:trehalase [Weeksellaceae bacterium]
MKPNLYIEEFFDLFDAVQRSKIFEDQKVMADAIPLFSISEINEKFRSQKGNQGFDLKEFVLQYFKVQSSEPSVDQEEGLPIDEHIEQLWDELTRTASEDKGTLLKLPKPYIVPGGRFNEFFYWDSYYVMLGLQVSGRIEMMKNIVENCAYLINTFGFVPNASRTYFLSRSQPPYFSLMLDLIFGSTNDKKIYSQYFETLEKEYQFWMNGVEDLPNGNQYRRVIKTENGDVLNRYFDDENAPRPESYMIDVEDAETSSNPEFYRNVRAACESGWDFSSRWFADGKSIQTIETLHLAQVDLNCLLWHLEMTLAKASGLQNFEDKKIDYSQKAEARKLAIDKYFWSEDEKIYKDYNIKSQSKTSSEHIAALYPLFLNLSNQDQAKAVSETINEKFLKKGGLITTTKESGQQWDAPNAWAPYQWLGFVAMKNYGFDDLAEKIKNNWCSNVERIYENTGKLMEKYNAIDTTSIAGGGEYPNQDGFGWTNGVYIKLKTNKQ